MSLISRFIGPRHVQMAQNWLSTAGFFGASATGVFLYLTDWKVVVANLPFYGGKFTEEKLE